MYLDELPENFTNKIIPYTIFNKGVLPMANEPFTFEIKGNICDLGERVFDGFNLEFNIVSFRGLPPKFDIRHWNADHTRMTKGMSFTVDEMKILIDAIKVQNKFPDGIEFEKEADKEPDPEAPFTFEIVEHIAPLGKSKEDGFTKECNRVSFRGLPPKYDVREWNSFHTRMTKGITLTDEQMCQIYNALKDIDLEKFLLPDRNLDSIILNAEKKHSEEIKQIHTHTITFQDFQR